MLIFKGNKFWWILLGFLSVKFYIHCLRYNICSTWFLDIRISTCFHLQALECSSRQYSCHATNVNLNTYVCIAGLYVYLSHVAILMLTSTPLCHVHQDYGTPYLIKLLRLLQHTPSNYYYMIIGVSPHICGICEFHQSVCLCLSVCICLSVSVCQSVCS